MQDLRAFLAVLHDRGELIEIEAEVDPRHLAALLAQTDKAILFQRVAGSAFRAVGNVLATRERCALAMQADPRRAAWRFLEARERAASPVSVPTGPCKDRVLIDPGQVDLSRLPIPLLHAGDGAPYLTAGVAVAVDESGNRNAGCYRMMYRTSTTTGIDLVSNSDLATLCRQALAVQRPVPIAVILGTHPVEELAAAYAAPAGRDELAIAGALKGEPIPVVRCETSDLHVPAYAEIVLEGEILPVGWTEMEGPFGEFQRLQGLPHWNPVVRIKAITHRADAILQIVTHPWEGGWAMNAIPMEANCLEALMAARVEATALHVTRGGVLLNVVASIRKKPGQGKTALLALLSTGFTKHAIVVDDDIDIFDPVDVEWAVATRVQADKDLITVQECRAKALDPSTLHAGTPEALTTRWGIDATIPEGRNPAHFRKFQYAFADEVRIEDYGGRGGEPTPPSPFPAREGGVEVSGESPSVERTTEGTSSAIPAREQVAVAGSALSSERARLGELIQSTLRQRPSTFYDVLRQAGPVSYQAFLQAWSDVQETGQVKRDESGRHFIATLSDELVTNGTLSRQAD